jgi:hypothetical protein
MTAAFWPGRSESGRRPTIIPRGTIMKKTIAILAALFVAGAVNAQTTTAVKESGKAVAEKAMEGKETVQAAVTGEPKKTVHRAKAKVHKAKAANHSDKAKAAGDQIGK